MKEHMKGFAAGVCASVLVLGLSATALAASGTVSFNSVNLRFNGTQISAKGENYTISNGASVPSSILYTDENGGGTTYLPVARVSELLGVDIAWDGATGSVVIGEERGTPIETPAPSNPSDTTSAYSDWSAEEEAVYQEFKAMWEISYQDKHMYANVIEKIPSAEFIAFLQKHDSKIKEYANRFIIEAFNETPSYALTEEGGIQIYFMTYDICSWGGGYSKKYDEASNTYNLTVIIRDINQFGDR